MRLLLLNLTRTALVLGGDWPKISRNKKARTKIGEVIGQSPEMCRHWTLGGDWTQNIGHRTQDIIHWKLRLDTGHWTLAAETN